MSHHERREVTRTHPGELTCDVRVHHYDQLDDCEQQWLHAVVHECEDAPGATSLDTGDVVVFTDYYQVQ